MKFFVRSPFSGFLQATLLLIVWIHGCIGVYFWLSLKPGFPRVKNLLLSFAVLLPALALLGYAQGGRQTLQSAQDPLWQAEHLTPQHIGTPAQNARLLDYRTDTLVFLAGALAAAFLARGLRRWRENRVGFITLTYPDRSIRARRGLSVLEASLRTTFRMPMSAAAGAAAPPAGSASSATGALPPASAAEQAVLDRIAAGPGVRLACQLRPSADIAFVPLLPPHASIADVRRRGPASTGDERYVVIMFVDMRGSSRLAEKRLPYDTVFIINQFLNAVSRAVINSGGEPNQILGDGLLALFGLRGRPAEAAGRRSRHAPPSPPTSKG